MPTVVSKPPMSDSPKVDNAKVVDPQQEVLTGIVQQLETHDSRLKSLREPFDKLQLRLNEIDGRLNEVETGLGQFERGVGPAVSEIQYQGLQPKDIFVAVLVGVLQGTISKFPQILSGKPAMRQAHIASAIDVAAECVSAAAVRLPKMNKA
jgi:hypothetical protein